MACHMHADLVRSARRQPCLDQADCGVGHALDPVAGQRLLAAANGHRHALAVPRIAPDRAIHFARRPGSGTPQTSAK